MNENTIISLADSNYFNLLNELIDSINRFEQSKGIDICIMDAGLTNDQIKILQKKVFQILTKIFLKHLAVSIIWARKLKRMVN